MVEISYLAPFAVLVTIQISPLHDYLATLYDTLESTNMEWPLLLLPAIVLTCVVPGGLLWIMLHTVKKEFRFYFAKACFMFMSKQEDDYKKIKYFLMGLNSYNKYLRRKLRLEVKDFKKIHSKFAYVETAEKREIIKSVCEAVEAGDRLKLARYLSSLSKIPETELFVSEAPIEKLKTIGTILAAVIPIIISAIELLKR